MFCGIALCVGSKAPAASSVLIALAIANYSTPDSPTVRLPGFLSLSVRRPRAGRAASETFEERSWLRVPAGGKVSMTSVAGCEVFIKEGEWLRRTPEES